MAITICIDRKALQTMFQSWYLEQIWSMISQYPL